ncbi:MAG: imm11 family protein [Candidatus Cyclobacteriaceae bacterium M2_1C_046]
MKYYIIKEAAGTIETGRTYPQTDGLRDGYNFDSPNSVHCLKFHCFPNFLPDLNYFNLHSDSKLTDVISTSAISAYGLLISTRFKNVIEKFNISTHAYYPATIRYNENLIDNYFWFHLLGIDILEAIKFNESNFYIKKGLKRLENISFNSFQELDSAKVELGNLKIIKSDKLVLNKKFNFPDLFVIPYFDGDIYISERLKDAILSHHLTGIEIKETNKLIYNLN